jgi:hypothetical protein
VNQLKLQEKYTIEKDYEIGAGYSYDIYFKEINWGIELDGETHFYGLSNHLKGKSKLKYRVYEQLGIDYCVLEWYTYPELRRAEKRGEFLKKFILENLERREDFICSVDPHLALLKCNRDLI